ncbi:MAG: hypothetical protein COB23_02985 [Methylophaga sp.]|nr:MAG: hypothetical protein COB23_02985 [Methylophaga sp.]
MRQATQEDFTIPEFRGKSLDDYEVREDGKCVRKDRWETAIHAIRDRIGMGSNREFEIDDIVAGVENIMTTFPNYEYNDEKDKL